MKKSIVITLLCPLFSYSQNLITSDSNYNNQSNNYIKTSISHIFLQSLDYLSENKNEIQLKKFLLSKNDLNLETSISFVSDFILTFDKYNPDYFINLSIECKNKNTCQKVSEI